jgi:hypothetical protein
MGIHVCTYALPVPQSGTATLEVKVGMRPLRIGRQGGVPQLWALVDSEAGLYKRRVKMLRHDEPFDADEFPVEWAYLGSFRADTPSEDIFHVFLGPVVL